MKNVFTQAQAAMKHLIKHSTHKHRSGKGVVTEATRPLLNFSLLRTPFRLTAILCFLLTIGVGEAWGATSISVNISTYASANSWSNGFAYSSISIDANVTATGLTNGNNSKYYSSNTSWRHYEGDGGTITISTSSGTISSVTFTYDNGNNGVIKYNGTNKTSGTAISVSGSSVSFTVGHSSGTKSGNVQITAISVTYTAATPAYTITAQSNNNSYGTVSVSGTTITATPADCYQVVSGTGGYTVTSGTATVSHTGTSNTLTVTPSTNCTVQVNFEKKTVNTYVDEIQDNGTIEDCSTTAPSLTDKSAATTGTCAQQHYHFMGWVTAANKANPTDDNIIEAGETVAVNGTTYYAVWAKGSGGSSFDNTTSGNFVIYANVNGTNYYATSTVSSYTLLSTTTAADAQIYTFTKAGNYWTITYTIEGSAYYLTAPNSNIGDMSNFSTTECLWKIESVSTHGSWRIWSRSPDGKENNAFAYRALIYKSGTGFKNYAASNVSASGDYYDCEIGSITEYSDYITTCCTELGQINGSVTLSQLATPNPTKLKATWSMNATTGIASYDLEVYNSSNVKVKTINNYTSGDEITGLDPCTTYYVKLYTVSSGGSYCEGGLIGTSSNCTTNGYTLTINKSNVTLSSGTEPTNVCANVSATYSAAAGYSLPTSITVTNAGAQNTGWTWYSSTGVLTINKANVTGNVTVTIAGVAETCTGMYTFAYGETANSDGKNIDDPTYNCFSQVGSTSEYEVTGFTIPTTTQYYWVGYNGYFYNDNLGTGDSKSKSSRNQFKYLPVTHLQSSGCTDAGDNYNHAMAGAYGRLRIFINSGDNNLYVGFDPAGYFMRVGSGDSWSNIQLTQEGSSAVWKSAVMDMSAALIAKNYYVQLQTGASYSSSDEGASINSWTNGNSTISSMSRKTNAGDNWTSGVTAGLRGYFRIWTDNCADNGYAHFVPTHRIIYHANYPYGDSPDDTYSVDVSVEETNNSIVLASAPSAPTGYTFAGWYDAASGGNEVTGTQTISAGASADVELYAQWTANTINLTLDKNNSDASGSNDGNGTIVFDGNATATITGATRTGHTVEGYYTDAACTAANKVLDASGNVINSTVSGYTTSGKWTCATTPTTLYTKWTPNNYTVTWSVNNQTWTNGVSAANNHADYGTTVTAPTGDGNVPTGAELACGTYTFMGWSASVTPTADDGGTDPGDLFTTTSPAITGDVTFYAVFAEASGSAATYTKVTSAPTPDWSGTYLFVREHTDLGIIFDGITANSNNYDTAVINDHTIKGSYHVYNCDIQIIKHSNDDYYSLKNSNQKYLCGTPASSSNNAILFLDADTANYEISISSSRVRIWHHGADASKGFQIFKQKDGNNAGTFFTDSTFNFKYYNSNQTQFVLYKKSGGITYSNYKTYCDNTKAYVNYNAAGGTTSCTRETVTKGEDYTVCSTPPTRSGYEFTGWSDGVTTYNAGGTISDVQSDIVLTAQWSAIPYTITYNGVKTGATNSNPATYTVEDLPLVLSSASHTEWRFDGWTDDNNSDADITTIPAGTTGNQSFTAHWTARYAVTWYVESTPTIEYYNPGATLQFPADPSAPTSCSEKQFVGWMVGTIEGETDDKPTFISAGEVNAAAGYHAVWANAAGSAIAAVEDNTFTQSDVSKETYCGISNGLQSVGKYVQNQSIWSSTQMTGVNVKIKVYHVSNSTADVLRVSLINSSGEEVVGTDLTTTKTGTNSASAGYSSNVTLTPTSAVTGYKVSMKTLNSYGTAVGKVTREVVSTYSKYSTSCCDNNVAAPSVTATATRNSITLSWTNVTDATGYKVTINGATHDVTTAACTYTESGLTSGTDYAWTVIATYNPASYCGALPAKSTTATLSVYGVTYNKNTTIGSGTVTMSPMPSDASTYVVGENVTAAAKPASCTNSGYTFNGWNTEPDGTGTHVDANGTIEMVAGGLTLYAEWVAKRAYYVDRMHGQGDQTIEIGGKTYHCYYGDGYHTTPSPSDQKSGDACQTPHYRFVRWLTIGHINADGSQKDSGGAVGGGVQRGTVTDGETYYAIWEEEIVEP